LFERTRVFFMLNWGVRWVACAVGPQMFARSPPQCNLHSSLFAELPRHQKYCSCGDRQEVSQRSARGFPSIGSTGLSHKQQAGDARSHHTTRPGGVICLSLRSHHLQLWMHSGDCTWGSVDLQQLLFLRMTRRSSEHTKTPVPENRSEKRERDEICDF